MDEVSVTMSKPAARLFVELVAKGATTAEHAAALAELYTTAQRVAADLGLVQNAPQA